VRRAAAIVLAAALAAVAALQATRAEPGLSHAGGSLLGRTALLVPGLVAVAIGLEARRRRPREHYGTLLALAGIASFLPELAGPGAGSSAAFTAGLVLAWSAPPLIVHAALAYPREQPSKLARATLVLGYASVIGALGALPALVSDPAARGCAECHANLLLVHGDAQLQTRLAQGGIAAALAWALLAVALLATRLARGSAALRSIAWPVIVPAVLALTCFAVELALSLRRGFLATDQVDRALWRGQQLALLGLAGGIAAGWLRARRSRGMLARDTLELASQPVTGGIRERLARTLRDPALELAYPVGEPVDWVDARGRPVAEQPPDGLATTLLRSARGEPLALLRHRPGTLADPAVVDEIARASGLALAHERLQVGARVQLATLRASRVRIVRAADSERERLERDLHDGAQQRLVSLAVTLRLASAAQAPRVAEGPSWAFDEAQRELAAALVELRVIAHGLYPGVLTDQGLAPALEALSESARVPVVLAALPSGRCSAAVEAAAYFVVSEAVRGAGPTGVTVRVAREGDKLALAVESEAGALDVTAAEDRIGALGGSVAATPLPGGRARLVAELPCES
jgi:signal transduction histidine kinase